MTTVMAALNSANIIHVEFVKMTVGSTPALYTFCNAAEPITVNGTTYSGLGSYLGVSEITQEVKATSVDLSVSLTGIDPANIALLLSTDIKGSQVEVWRGFLDSDNQIITTPTQQFFKRYTGIINSVAINEDWNEAARSRVATCSVACTSMRKVLESRLAGLKTNQKSWQFFYPTDTSMNRVAQISNTYFDFGQRPQKGGTASTPVESNIDIMDSAGSP